MDIKTIVLSIRAPFLVLTLICVFLGASTSTSIASLSGPDLMTLSLALIGALSAHISVNTLNEYFDFKSGLDLETVKTPFSGGSGALPENPSMARQVLATGVLTSVAVILIGSFFIWQRGITIIPIGIIGLLLITSYTGWINKHPFICLVSPGLGFGFLMVTGTQFVLDGMFTMQSSLVAVVPFLLVNNLLLINQYPDIKADLNAGRNHFPIAFGIKRSNVVYGFFSAATAAFIIAMAINGKLPLISLIALLPLSLTIFTLYGAVKHGEAIGSHPKYLGANVAATILTTMLLGLSLIV
jgi:1,4-dihydroxy-2-naphthoate polyprenyltransferase